MSDIPVDPLSPGSEPAQHYDSVVDAWGELLEEDLHYGYFLTGDETLVEATDELTNQMQQLAEPRAGEAVLDVGCGTGKAGCRLAAEFSARVTGISPSQACVERANSHAGSLGLSGLAQFSIGDGTHIDFADESFDRVWVMESSHLMPDKKALIAECARVLRPGGRMVLCDIMLHRKLPLEDVIAHRDDFLLLRDVFGRAVMEPLQFYRQAMQDNGLTVLVEEDISEQTFKTFEHWRTNATQKRELISQMIGEKAWKQFLLSADVLANFWSNKVLGYGIIAATKPR